MSRSYRRFQLADEAICTSHSLQGKKAGKQKRVEEVSGRSGWGFRSRLVGSFTSEGSNQIRT